MYGLLINLNTCTKSQPDSTYTHHNETCDAAMGTAQRVGLVQSQAISVNNRVGNHNHTPLFTKYVV